MWRFMFFVGVLVALSAVERAPAATFELLGRFPNPSYPSSWAYGVSADGEVVVGHSTSANSGAELPFRWTSAEGMVNIAGLSRDQGGYAWDVSAHGSVVVGFLSPGAGAAQAFRWTQRDGLAILPTLPGREGLHAVATGVTADGTTVVGYSYGDFYPATTGRLFRWREVDGMVDLGPGLEAYVSADGSVIVGNDPVQGAFRWTEATGRVYLGSPPGFDSPPYALNVSADGSTVVGRVDYPYFPAGDWKAFRWTQQEGSVLLLGQPYPDGYQEATGVSADGSVVVGVASLYGDDFGFVWDAARGARNLREVLKDEYGLQLDNNFALGWARDISADGRVIVGTGGFRDGSGEEAWRVVIPEPSSITLTMSAFFALLLFALGKRSGISERFSSIRRSR